MKRAKRVADARRAADAFGLVCPTGGITERGLTRRESAQAHRTRHERFIDGNTHLAGKTGNATRAPTQLDLTLSANQQAFEDLILGPTGARYEFLWT